LGHKFDQMLELIGISQ